MNHLVDQYFDSLSDKKVAVLGIGVSNRPLIRMLLARGIHVLACDKTPREKLDAEVLELEQAGAVLHVGEGYLDDVRADVVFRTPGMHPEIPALRRLRAAGAEITSEMEAFFEVCPCRIIAVTGSDGKTTTTTLIAKILEHAGHRVWIGGNIGAPLLPQAAEMTPTDLAVVELSSFQLMSMERSADIAVVTNVAPNHLDVHKDMAEYVQAKKNVFAHQNASGKVVLNYDNDITRAFAADAPGAVEFFSRQARPAHGVYLEDGTVRNQVKSRYQCHFKARHPDLCDGQSGYGVIKLDEIVDALVRYQLSRIHVSAKDSLIAEQHEKTTAFARSRYKMSAMRLEEKQKELSDYEAETINVIRGKSRLNVDLLNSLVAKCKEEIAELSQEVETQKADMERQMESAAQEQAEFEKLESWADLYDNCTFEAKKMIVSQLIKAVYVYRDYRLEVEFRVSFDDFKRLCVGCEPNGGRITTVESA